MKYTFSVLFSAAFLLMTGLSADEPSQPYAPSKVDAKLNLTIKPDTEILHFVRDNIHPNVVTKIYVLKHADPYELRQYILELLQVRKVDTGNTGIQAIKFNDGTSMLMISAENYRFDNFVNGESIDRIIETLDRPGITSVSGRPVYLYSPKYRTAQELREMIEEVGAHMADDETENIGGADLIRCDASLNLLALRTAPFSRKNIENVLKNYDVPYPEVRAGITVYEIYAENDAKMGLDFQAWKNNDGIDFFSSGGRFMQNYAPDGSSLSKGAGWSDTKYFNFNPKWNTKYIDFLASKGKAKVLHSSMLTVRNGTSGEIRRMTQVFCAKAEPIESSKYTVAYMYLPDTVFSSEPADGTTVVTAKTEGGAPVGIKMIGKKATLTVLQIAKDPKVANHYEMEIANGYFTVGNVNAGTKLDVSSVSAVSYKLNDKGVLTGTQQTFTDDSISAQKGNRIDLDPSNEFGFKLNITPSVTEQATILNVRVSNSSLIGYDSGGNPRIQKSAEVSSKFMVSNSGTKIVIGGIEKRDVVRVSGGVPVLKDIPVLGWLFSTESESTKRSQLLVVAEVVPVFPYDKLPAEVREKEESIRKDLKKAGDRNTWNYRQYFLDPERNLSAPPAGAEGKTPQQSSK